MDNGRRISNLRDAVLVLVVGSGLLGGVPAVLAQPSVQDFNWVQSEGKLSGLRSIPSMSMAPTLLTGDRAVIVQLEREPRRGDVVIFRHPKSKQRVMINRIIGVAGDAIEIKAGRLHLNGEVVPRKEVRAFNYVEPGNDEQRVLSVVEYEEQLPAEERSHLIHEFSDSDSLDETPRFIVPKGHLFMMGDNRDNSEDSRAPSGHRALATQFPDAWSNRHMQLPADASNDAIGFVPVENLMGRAVTVWFSLASCDHQRAAAQGAICLASNVSKRL